MADPEFWQQAKKGPGAPTAPGADSQVRRLHVLWTLTKGTHARRDRGAVGIESVFGFDLRYVYDGEVRETRLFRGVDGGTKATLAAAGQAR